MEAMRGNGILDVRDVQVAVLETNGTVSVIAKPNALPPSAKDMKLSVKENGGIPEIIVMNGKRIERNMLRHDVTEKQLNDILKGYDVILKDVFMLTMDDNNKTFFIVVFYLI